MDNQCRVQAADVAADKRRLESARTSSTVCLWATNRLLMQACQPLLRDLLGWQGLFRQLFGEFEVDSATTLNTVVVLQYQIIIPSPFLATFCDHPLDSQHGS